MPLYTSPDQDEPLVDRIENAHDGRVAHATLETDAQVLARVTDGIYREPASALRELISNAYDADATEVVIQTDRPRFGTITVSDNGQGMTPAVLAHLIQHIGGSAKRSAEGQLLGVTDANDRLRTHAGRRIIGRIGIGLFSVSQLTRSFQIITKVKGDPWRTVALVNLKTFSEELEEGANTSSEQAREKGGDPQNITPNAPTRYETGEASIWRIPAPDLEASGTSVILTELTPRAKHDLTSRDRWLRVRDLKEVPPKFHVGTLVGTNELRLEGTESDSLPWNYEDSPEESFRKLVDVVWGQLRENAQIRNPSLVHLFDNYLQMVWSLALAAPIPYAGTNPFEVDSEQASLFVYKSSSTRPEAAAEPNLAKVLGIENPGGVPDELPFAVIVDDLKLSRPLLFRDLPQTAHVLTRSILLGGSVSEDFAMRSFADSGGPLEFHAYIMWAPKIAPVEHNGSLIRVHGASGTLFDRTFMDYQIAELTRLKQLTCEIFVTRGFEAAMNIDREGFNKAHPHAVRITRWLHAAVGQIINEEKALANTARRIRRAAGEAERSDTLRTIVESVWRQRRRDDADPPRVAWTRPGSRHQKPSPGALQLDGSRILGDDSRGPVAQRQEKQLEAVLGVLSAYHLLDDMDESDIADLLSALARVLKEIA